MKKVELKQELSKLIKEHGIHNVLSSIATNHSSKVFIPNWYGKVDLEELGFEFDDEYFDMCAFQEFMIDRDVQAQTNYMLEDDYPCEWEDYKENNK
jgi:hypothetical protein